MRAGDRRIHVQIPAYRDPALLPTVADLVATAAGPEQLVVRVGLQHAPDDALRRLGPAHTPLEIDQPPLAME